MIAGALLRRRGSLLWLALIVAIGALLGWLALVPLLRAPSDGSIGTLVGRPAPELTAVDLGGRRWSLSDADGRLVWVNFWATSCGPCRTEMPAMQRLAEVHADDLLILGIDWGEEASAVADFAERYGIDYPILLDPRLDNYYRWAGTDGLPRHYFIGADGTVMRDVIGPLDPARMVAMLDELGVSR